MNAIVTAGGIPQPEDPLYEYANGSPKALLDVAGKPMIQWVLDALSDAQNVENVLIIGLDENADLHCSKPMYFLPNQGRMLANIVAGVEKTLELDPSAEYVIIVSSDIPGIDGGMVDWLINTAMQTHEDIYYGVVPREIMEARYPGANRTYTRLKDIEVCGADMNIAHVRMATEHLDTWEDLIGKRKSPLKQAASIGYGTLLRVLFHQITLEDLVATVTRRLGVTGRVIVWDKAEPAMDVDKPHQLEILRADIAKTKAA